MLAPIVCCQGWFQRRRLVTPSSHADFLATNHYAGCEGTRKRIGTATNSTIIGFLLTGWDSVHNISVGKVHISWEERVGEKWRGSERKRNKQWLLPTPHHVWHGGWGKGTARWISYISTKRSIHSKTVWPSMCTLLQAVNGAVKT